MSGLDQLSIGGAGRSWSDQSAKPRSLTRIGGGNRRVIRRAVSTDPAATRRIARKFADRIFVPLGWQAVPARIGKPRQLLFPPVPPHVNK